MFKWIFGLGLLAIPVYRAYKKRGSHDVPFINFSPTLTINTTIEVPIRSLNGRAAADEEPTNDKQKSIASNQHKTDGNHQLTDDDQQRTGDNQQPVTDKQSETSEELNGVHLHS